MGALAYCARYAPGAPIPWLLSLTEEEFYAFHKAVNDLVSEENRVGRGAR